MMFRVLDSWYDKSETTIESVDVEVTRKIRVDGSYKIQPTEAYLGIECGTIRITHIAMLCDLVDIGDDLRMQADEFARVLLDNIGEDSPEWITEDTRLCEQPWVVYQYSKLPEDRYCLPLEEFVIHTTIY